MSGLFIDQAFRCRYADVCILRVHAPYRLHKLVRADMDQTAASLRATAASPAYENIPLRLVRRWNRHPRILRPPRRRRINTSPPSNFFPASWGAVDPATLDLPPES